MEALISKWHRELELFSGIKPLLILEGNVLDQYRYPVAGSLRQDEIVPLSRYLFTYFKDEGYDQIVFYSNLVGFVCPYDSGMLERYARLTGTQISSGAVQAEFKGNDANGDGQPLHHDARAHGSAGCEQLQYSASERAVQRLGEDAEREETESADSAGQQAE